MPRGEPLFQFQLILVYPPDDELVESYGIINGNDDGNKEKGTPSAAVITKVDKKPMGV